MVSLNKTGASANTASLQKRLSGLAAASTGANKVPIRIKKEPEDKKPAKIRRRTRTSSGSSEGRTPSPPSKRSKGTTKPAVPLVTNIKKEGQTSGSSKRDRDRDRDRPDHDRGAPSSSKQQIKLTLKSSSSHHRPTANKSVLEKLGYTESDASSSRKRKASTDEMGKVKIKQEKKDKPIKKEKKSQADRREELLKQLEAVENAIKKKRKT